MKDHHQQQEVTMELQHQEDTSATATTTTKDELLNSSITTASTTCSSSSSSGGSSDFWNVDLSDLLVEEIQDPLFQQYLAPPPSSPTSQEEEAEDPATTTPTSTKGKCRRKTPLRLLSLPNKKLGGGSRSRSPSPLRRITPTRCRRRCVSLNNSSKPDPSDLTTQNTRKTIKRRVSFDKVRIREFNQVLGDNPCKDNNGPSLTLGWNYHEKKTKDIDKYESSKSSKNSSYVKQLFRSREAAAANGTPYLSPEKRRERALKLGFTTKEIDQNQQQNHEIQQQRQQTLQEEKQKQKAINTFTATTLEEALVLLERGQLDGVY